MNHFEKYLTLMRERPDLFANKGEEGEIRIITDKKRILAEQKKIRAKLKQEGKPSCWIDIGVLAEDEWFYILRDMVEFPNGQVGGYLRWINRKSEEGGGYNVVLMCMQGDKVLMIRKFRHENRDWSWEFPRGFGEPGLSAEENARMELQEEVGVSKAKLTCLTKVKQGKGGTAVFLVEIPEGQRIKLEKEEGLSNYRWVTISQLEKIVKKGQINDWFSLWALVLSNTKDS